MSQKAHNFKAKLRWGDAYEVCSLLKNLSKNINYNRYFVKSRKNYKYLYYIYSVSFFSRVKANNSTTTTMVPTLPKHQSTRRPSKWPLTDLHNMIWLFVVYFFLPTQYHRTISSNKFFRIQIGRLPEKRLPRPPIEAADSPWWRLTGSAGKNPELVNSPLLVQPKAGNLKSMG